MDHGLEEEIRQLLSSGNKIAAIKRYREETGVGLAEAKSAVEALEAGHSLVDRPQAERTEIDGNDLVNQVVALLEQGHKIQAIKLFRTNVGCDLKTAKAAVEKIAEQHGILTQSNVGCLGVILAGIALFY